MDFIRNYFNAISPISTETWLEIAPLFEKRELQKNDFFIKEHIKATEIGFLEKGCVRAFFTNKEAKEYNKQFFIAPSLIGAYTSLLTGKINKIPQQALTECTLWVVNFKALEKRYSQYHDLERLGRKIAEYYFLEKEEKELEMALKDATQRYLIFSKKFPNLDQKIPQYHIASYLGISATQLSRLRNKLSKNIK
ncbi:Crp/Fnr family transcriptional regulator [Flammeovirga kamogawensis]|uniref:Crp/Fnr family transcriptional regulator n=1 Tax=Flammeovirga kamogawensis TaxID=373891 RepID=A0ABX8GZT0_9BACT|nr:Crp/Fnr family transcriptional regulator [Flammeovirga kamogawensis]MBB6459298.1 CRP-like cAMP-binding protein [Flammeovirga kamogawensis]QWG08858.1 Crp/Fnr family transcriptional regulator [Flammeovirga kamogawensis]TRX67148.1 Crp/Fnr family transcriptional regulator [Flammeovirga kamogawensis]